MYILYRNIYIRKIKDERDFFKMYNYLLPFMNKKSSTVF